VTSGGPDPTEYATLHTRHIKIKTSSIVKGNLICLDEFTKTRDVQSDPDSHVKLRHVILLLRYRTNGKLKLSFGIYAGK
jgi:hypothetical protein